MVSNEERIAVLEAERPALVDAISRVDRRSRRLPKVLRKIVKEVVQEEITACRKIRGDDVDAKIKEVGRQIEAVAKPPGGIARAIGWGTTMLGLVAYGAWEAYSKVFGGGSGK